MKKKTDFMIDTNMFPKVLLLGNGILRLGDGGKSWDQLLENIRTREIESDLIGIPYAMQPEASCGSDVEDIQRRVSKEIPDNPNPHRLFKELLSLPFDAVLTTNYTYEIEKHLSDNEWTKYQRKIAFTALDGKPYVNHNTHVCNAVKTLSGRVVPVFHIHGERERKHSMILSYYSYANAVARLIKYNKEHLSNSLFEHQDEGEPFKCKCWLDYFIMGDVWSVGLGMDFSEFDIWWAIERKSRENAKHGGLHVFIEDNGKTGAQKEMLDAMGADPILIPIKNREFEPMYENIISEIRGAL